MSEAVETIFNKESSKSKIRGHDGYVNNARSHNSASKCLKEKVITEIISSFYPFLGVWRLCGGDGETFTEWKSAKSFCIKF